MRRLTAHPAPTAQTAGYLRISNIQFPDGCDSPDARRAHIEALRQARMAELAADACRDGDAITAWYDDLGVSGLGESLERRSDFERLRRDAQRGHIRCLYARDLSRLFRDLVQQELWFCEMEAYGVPVRVQDLPHVSDAATRTLVRQQLGAINEYMARRQGAIIRAVLTERVRTGLWVGCSRSLWGLRYEPGLKGYAFDPDTADKARLVFEVFVAEGGIAHATAVRLNRMQAEGAPRATATHQGTPWRSKLILRQIRSPLYRQATAVQPHPARTGGGRPPPDSGTPVWRGSLLTRGHTWSPRGWCRNRNGRR